MKYWLILIKDKERKLTCFSKSPIVLRRSRILGFEVFYASFTHCSLFSQNKNKPQRNLIGMWCLFARGEGGGITGRRLCRIKAKLGFERCGRSTFF